LRFYLALSSTLGGTVTTPGEGAFEYDHGSEVSVIATADLNYHFTGWTGSAVDTGKVADPNAASTTISLDQFVIPMSDHSPVTVLLDAAAPTSGSGEEAFDRVWSNA
jgi:hypothetical protein